MADEPEPETGAGAGAEAGAEPGAEAVAGPSRRSLLLGVLAGTVGGVSIGTAGLHWGPRLFGDRPPGHASLRVYGGDDSQQARTNALQVWNATPATEKSKLGARYHPISALADQQFYVLENLFAAAELPFELVVVDPEYLPALAAKKQVVGFDRIDGSALRDLGCFPTLVSRCQVPGTGLAGVPLNADGPVLVVDRSLLGPGDADRMKALAGLTDPRAFWLAAVRLATGPGSRPEPTRRLLIETGDYEGFTVCLVELIGAFGGDVRADPGLASARNRAALAALRGAFPDGFFEEAGDSRTEGAVAETMTTHGAVVGRLWPAYTRDLTAGSLTGAEESSNAGYELIPIPRGVLGGQVLAVANRPGRSIAAQDLATYLAQPLSQLQLFFGGGYVPTLRQVHAVTQVKQTLAGLGDLLDSATLRPGLARYFDWSTQFRRGVRAYLTGDTDDVAGRITAPLHPLITS